MTNSTVFNYSEYESDYITRYLQDHGDETPDWFKTFILGDSSVSQNRDDDLEDYLSATTYVPSIGVSCFTPVSITSGSFQEVEFDTLDYASTGSVDWSPTPAPSHVTVEESGIISVTANVAWGAGGNDRELLIVANNLTVLAGATGAAQGGAINDRYSASVTYNAAAGDFLAIQVLQASGGPLLVMGSMQVSVLGKAG